MLAMVPRLVALTAAIVLTGALAAGVATAESDCAADDAGAQSCPTSGDDRQTGGAEDDVQRGGAGNDTQAGGGGSDVQDGGPGHDVQDGGGGADMLRGGPGSDVQDGGSGPDRLDGGPGNETQKGGSGADTIVTGGGSNVVQGDGATTGAAGNDVIYAQNWRRDRVDCGGGRRDRVYADRFDQLVACEVRVFSPAQVPDA